MASLIAKIRKWLRIAKKVRTAADEDISDEDQTRVHEFFTLLRDVATELEELQIIVPDHANLPDDWFQHALVENWRNGKALVPQDWLTDGEKRSSRCSIKTGVGAFATSSASAGSSPRSLSVSGWIPRARLSRSLTACSSSSRTGSSSVATLPGAAAAASSM